MATRRDEPQRPSSEAMLARLRAEAADHGEREEGARGRLRVYLGMAPGVGKTYSALEEVHRRHERGTDIVVGFAECHGRPRTEALLEGLEVLPRLRVEYQGVTVEEMDTDAVIARRPRVAFIDELAHTNAPGSPHVKRWEDVELIRDAGIDVITTCNIQHLELVADAVETITGAPVRERLPDDVLEMADEIELVDMSPHALRQRIRHGNVYPPDRARVALDRFFTEANLTALRELSLRRVTQRVDEELQDIMTAIEPAGPLPVGDRVMVVVEPGPGAHRVIRRAASVSAAMHVPFDALFVETPEFERLPHDRQQDLREDLEYAGDLGAEIVRRRADDLVSGVVAAVSSRRVSHLVVGHRPPRGLTRLVRHSLATQLLDRMPGVDIHLVTPEMSAEP